MFLIVFGLSFCFVWSRAIRRSTSAGSIRSIGVCPKNGARCTRRWLSNVSTCDPLSTLPSQPRGVQLADVLDSPRRVRGDAAGVAVHQLAQLTLGLALAQPVRRSGSTRG